MHPTDTNPCVSERRREGTHKGHANCVMAMMSSSAILLPGRLAYLFMAMARVLWASNEMEPYDIAPVQNRRTMLSAGSTSSNGISLLPLKLKSRRPLGWEKETLQQMLAFYW